MTGTFNRRVKTALGQFTYRTGLHQPLFRDKAVVALFHRVDDALGDNPISCTTVQLDAFLEFFARHFHVVPFSALLDKLERGDDISRHLAITFDDGYKDNLELAAPALLRHQLPACFFIATGFIGTSTIPPWDREWGVETKWMTWDDVRTLRSLGFEIGAHTITHVDLSVVSGPEAEREIRESGERLETELGEPVTLFSYPFGRANQITEENRLLVRKAGYRCCPSAYGGTIAPGADPFRIRRIPISPWHLSPYQFGFETVLVKPD